MNSHSHIPVRLGLLLALLVSNSITMGHAQGTAFTYQGRLTNDGSLASGSYDLQFSLFATNAGGVPIAGPVTNSAVSVSNGLFTATIDFGSAFTGASNWLQIAVSTNGANSFSTLSPRQQIRPTPYAIMAENVSGTVSAAQVTGTLAATNLPANPSFSGTVTANALAGNGAGVTNVNGVSLNGLNATNFWQTGGNSVASGQFLGSLNNQPVELWVNTNRALRLEYAYDNNFRQAAPNVIAGSPANTVTNGYYGNVLLGGGPNQIGANYAAILGGVYNSVSGAYGIAGGTGNSITSGGSQSVALGYYNNANALGSVLLGQGNRATGGQYGVAIGNLNTAANSGSIGIGYDNSSSGTGSAAIGYANTASGFAALALGYLNVASGDDSAALGNQAHAPNTGSFVWSDSSSGAIFTSTGNNQFLIRAEGGVGINTNSLSGLALHVAGNVLVDSATNFTAVARQVALGYNVVASGNYSTAIGPCAQATNTSATAMGTNSVAGGYESIAIGGNNTASGDYSTALGQNTSAVGEDSIALGVGAQASGLNSSSMGSVTIASGNYATALGNETLASGQFSTALGVSTKASGQFSTALGASTKASGNYSTAIGQSTVASGNESTAMGYLTIASSNNCTAMGYTTVASGDSSTAMGSFTTASGDSSTALGSFTTASSYGSTAVGNQTFAGGRSATAAGQQTSAAGDISTALGYFSQANGVDSTAMGGRTIASGYLSTALGWLSLASGQLSIAMGNQAVATNDGSFVWADDAPGVSSGFGFYSTADNQFSARATGGVRFVTAVDTIGNPTAGVQLQSGDTSWSTISDQNAKKNFQAVNGEEILNKLASVPVEKWNYKWEKDSDVPNIGPMAQGFKAAFYPGRDDKSITTLEFDGVELAAIQGLNEKVESGKRKAETEIAELKTENAELKQQLAELKTLVQQLARAQSK